MDVEGTHQTVTGLSTAQPISVPRQSGGIIMQAFSQNVRFTIDGSTIPTASVGFLVFAGDPPIKLDVPSGGTLRAIEESAGASLAYQFI